MKHINIPNWQGKITDYTKFNYIYGGLDEIIADRVNLRIPGTNSRNYIEQNQYGWLILTENVAKDKNNKQERTRNIVLSSVDVTGSLGVWGITQLNNGVMRTGR